MPMNEYRVEIRFDDENGYVSEKSFDIKAESISGAMLEVMTNKASDLWTKVYYCLVRQLTF